MTLIMMRKNVKVLNRLDWVTVIIFISLVIAGWFSIWGASYDFENPDLFTFTSRTGKQFIWIMCSFALALVILFIEQKFFHTYAYLIYTVFIIILLVTIFVASNTKGSYSWIHLGPISIQPAEFAKFATALALAKLLDGYGFVMNIIKNQLKAVLIFLVPMILIIAQKETGSALVYCVFFLVLFREGMSGLVLYSGFCAVLFFVLGIKYWDQQFTDQPFNIGPLLVLTIIQIATAILAWVYVESRSVGWIILFSGIGTLLAGLLFSLFIFPFKLPVLQIIVTGGLILYLLFLSLMKRKKECAMIALFAFCSVAYLYSCNYVFSNILQPHHQSRINVMLGLEDDLHGAGYNVNQSKIAIGSGGGFGKGFLKGTQTKLKYVPEQDTDFIFCTIGEEKGFLGSTVVLLVFVFLLLRLIFLAERQSSVYGRTFGYSVISILFFHLFINVGMVLGITPVIGIPLPFFSYGGSSLWGFTILLFVFLRIDVERTERF